MSSDLDLLIGKWIVKVRPPGAPEPWTWEYDFQSGGRVTWQDLKSAEKGSGTWTTTPKLVNISWTDSATRESWKRPLTPTPPLNMTWYDSSYYRGTYKIEKPVCAGFSTDGPFKLAAPGEVSQGDLLLCWAAGAASWLIGTKRGTATVNDLVKKYKERGKLDNDNALPEENMVDVFGDIGIALKHMPGVDFTYCFTLEKLKTKGHLLLLSGHGDDMGHTQVVWGVGDPSNEYFDIFDPWKNRAFSYRKFSDLAGNNIYVGWAK